MTPVNCQYHPETESVAACGDCQKPICTECKVQLNDKTYCKPCVEAARARVRSALQDLTSNPNYAGAMALGVVAAVVGAFLWQFVGSVLHLHIGYVAIATGYLVGTGVVKGAGNKRGVSLQIISVLLALLGIAGGLVLEAHSSVLDLLAQKQIDASDEKVWTFIFTHFGEILKEYGPITWAIAAFGLYEAYRRPKAPQIAV